MTLSAGERSRHVQQRQGMLWHCWLGGRKGIRPIKKLECWGAGVVICLERGAYDLHIVGLEQESVKCNFCRNWVIDCIMFNTLKSTWEIFPMSKFALFIPVLSVLKLSVLHYLGYWCFASEQESVISDNACAKLNSQWTLAAERHQVTLFIPRGVRTDHAH